MCFFREYFAREPRTRAWDRFDRAGLSKWERINFVGQHAKESSSSQREYKYTTPLCCILFTSFSVRRTFRRFLSPLVLLEY